MADVVCSVNPVAVVSVPVTAPTLTQSRLHDLGGFEGIIMSGFVAPDLSKRLTTFDAPVYVALLEILVGTVYCPSEAAESEVESFGKPIQNASVVSIIMRLTPLAATWELKRDILKVGGCVVLL